MLVPENEQIISIDFNGQRLEKQKSLWRLSSTTGAVASEQLAEVVDNWTKVHARQVLAYSSTEDMQKITLSFSSGRTIHFDIVSTAPVLVLGRADLGLQYLLEKATGSRLLLPGPASNTTHHKQDKEFPG